jgi:uncharacterized protein (TIGR02284 family)
MESKNIGLTDALNSLIQINNDRISGYEKAVAQTQTEHPNLSMLCSEMAEESRDFVSVLKAKVWKLKGEAEDGNSFSGMVHRVFMEVKWIFSGTDKKAIITSCINGDTAALKAYDQALHSNAEMSAETRQLLISQQQSIQHALDRLTQEKNALELEPQH